MSSSERLLGRPVQRGRANKQYGEGRKCAHFDPKDPTAQCITVLSRYNKSDHCYAHIPTKVPKSPEVFGNRSRVPRIEEFKPLRLNGAYDRVARALDALYDMFADEEAVGHTILFVTTDTGVQGGNITVNTNTFNFTKMQFLTDSAKATRRVA